MGRPNRYRADPDSGQPPPEPRYKRSKNPKGWLPKKACLVLAFLWLPRGICICGVVFTIIGLILTVCGYTESINYRDRTSGPCLLAFGLVFIIAYILWKKVRRGPERESTDQNGIENPGFTRNGHANGLRSNEVIINIPPRPPGAIRRPIPQERPKSAPNKRQANGTSSKNTGAIPKRPQSASIHRPSSAKKSLNGPIKASQPSTSGLRPSKSTPSFITSATSSRFNNNSSSSSKLSQLSVEADTSVTASPVISLRGGRNKRNLGGHQQTVEVDLHHIPTIHEEPRAGPSGAKPKDGGIFVIPTIHTEDDEDEF